MLKSFLLILIFLLALSVVAHKLQSGPAEPGVVPIVWVSDDNPARQAQIALFKRLNPGYDLRLDPGNYSMEKIIVQSLAGVGPDVFDSFGAYSLSVYVKSGVAWDITDELAKMGIDARAMTWDVSHDSIIYKGRIYGFPTNAGVRVLLYNKDIFDEHGIDYPKGPWKWKEDFLPLAKRLTVRDSKGRVVQYALLSPWGHWEQFIRQWGGQVYTDDGTRCIIDSPEAIEAMQFVYDLVYKYEVSPSPAVEAAMTTQGGWGSGYISLFGGRKAAMAIGDRYWLCTLRDYKGLRMGAVEVPYQKVRVALGGSRVTLINRNSPRRNEALRFIAFLAGREYNELINYQADWLAPVKEYCFTDLYLHNPDFPEEDYNEVWRDAMQFGATNQISPFVNAMVAQRIIGKQMDLLRNRQKSVKDAMRAIARELNAEIQKTIQREPSLREEYERLRGTKDR